MGIVSKPIYNRRIEGKAIESVGPSDLFLRGEHNIAENVW